MRIITKERMSGICVTSADDPTVACPLISVEILEKPYLKHLVYRD